MSGKVIHISSARRKPDNETAVFISGDLVVLHRHDTVVVFEPGEAISAGESIIFTLDQKIILEHQGAIFTFTVEEAVQAGCALIEAGKSLLNLEPGI